MGQEIAIGTFKFSSIRNYKLTLRHKHINNVNSLRLRTSAIATQIEDKTLHALLLHLDYSIAEYLGASFRERLQLNIANAIVEQTIVRHSRSLDKLSSNLKLHHLASTWALNLQDKRGADIATQMVRNILCLLALHCAVVDSQYQVAFLQAHFCSRHTEIWLVDIRVSLFEIISNHRANTGILSRKLIFQSLCHISRIILSISIQRAEHSIYASTNNLVGIQSIDIQHIKVFIHRRKHLHILAHIKVMVVLLSKSHHRHHAAKHHREQSITFHHFLLSNINNLFSPPIPYYIYKETTNNIVTHTTNKDSKCKIKENIRYSNSFSSFYRKYLLHHPFYGLIHLKKAQKTYKNKLF